jgi:hypothetical protein
MTLEQGDLEVIKASARGGCLDAVVQIATLGHYGVETYIKQVSVTPTDINNLGDRSSEAWKSLMTGKTVIVTNFAPQIGRRIVKNR